MGLVLQKSLENVEFYIIICPKLKIRPYHNLQISYLYYFAKWITATHILEIVCYTFYIKQTAKRPLPIRITIILHFIKK